MNELINVLKREKQMKPLTFKPISELQCIQKIKQKKLIYNANRCNKSKRHLECAHFMSVDEILMLRIVHCTTKIVSKA